MASVNVNKSLYQRYRYIPHILVLVGCGVILNHMARLPVVPDSEATTGQDDDGVKEIFGVKIHRNPSQSKLQELGVASWPTWEGSPGRIPWTFTATETMYLLEGKVKVSCQGHEDEFQIGGGDLVVFPKGMKITWEVMEAVKKHYKLDK